jgi:acetylornithine deacetylase/succinyl-diaminopimelate desuccinylase-like protein
MGTDGRLEVTTNAHAAWSHARRVEGAGGKGQRLGQPSEARSQPRPGQLDGARSQGRVPTLLDIYGDTTGLEASPCPRRSTTAKLMPNAINFPAMPGKKYTAHNAKEYKEVQDLDADMQMFTDGAHR